MKLQLAHEFNGFQVEKHWTVQETLADGERLNCVLFAQANRAAVVTNGG